MLRLLATSLALVLMASTSFAEPMDAESIDEAMDDFRVASPEGAVVYIIAPSHGETLTSPVTVKFGLRGMGVAPAGVEQANTGHHHLMINRDLPPLDETMPADETLMHFGGGQTEAVIALEPGTHILQLILGDQNHIPHNPLVISEPVSITIIE